MKSFITICVVLPVLAISALAQSSVDQRGVYRSTEEEITRNKRIAEMLRRPTFISLRLLSAPRDVPSETATDTPAPYRVKDYLGFQLFITQNSSDVLRLGITTPYYDYRTELIQDGQLVPYSAKAEERTKRAETQPHSGSVFSITLPPGEEKRYNIVSLDDWYDPLAPGRYQLTVRKQFAGDGDWVVSNPVYFEVIPRPPGTLIPVGVAIELSPEGQPAKKNGIFQLSGEVGVVITVVNNSDQPLKLNVIDREYGNRPQLFKDGKLVPYRDDVTQRITAKEQSPRKVEIINDIFLDPKSRSWSQGISLKDWYGQLPPGSYRLTNRHRFEIDGPWTAESAPLLFTISAPSQK